MSKSEMVAAIVEKALRDPAFRESLLANPRLTLETKAGVSIPESLEIVVVEDTPTRMHLVLPAAAGERELTETELDTVAGGALSIGRGC